MLTQLRLLAATWPGFRAPLLLLIALLAPFSWGSVLAQELQCTAPQNEEQERPGFLVGDFESKLPPSFVEGHERAARGITLWTAGLVRDARWGTRNGQSRYPEKVDGQERPGSRAAPVMPASESNSAIRETSIGPTRSMVIIATGEKLLKQTDASVGGLYGMALDRTYRSINTTGNLFGPNWVSTLDPVRVTRSSLPCVSTEIGCIPRDATVTFPDGAKYKYTWMPSSPGEYEVNGNAAMGTLSGGVTRTSGWWLSMGTKSYNFNSVGRQTEYSDSSGDTATQTWVGGQLTKVTNRVGKTFNFT